MKRAVCFWAMAVCLLAWTGPQSRAADEPRIEADVVYGHKDGLALTFDVIRPAKPNGSAVLFLQSGGWYSTWMEPRLLVPVAQPFLDKGITMLIVRHGSAPKYTVPEAIEDVRRAVRVVRMRAKEWDLDPNRLGVLGGSAGGHLTLMLATTGDDGDAASKDPVLRHGSRIAAGVALYPPTDLRKWTTDPPAAIKAIPGLRPPLAFDAAKEADCSPLLKVTERTAPVLMIHGDKDELVPISHSEQILEVLEKAQVPCRLLTMKGAGHSFTAKDNAIAGPAMLEWFVKYLAEKKPE
ncbi:MAG: alpha/beta hydrolase family protein [Pirellulales bacterium]